MALSGNTVEVHPPKRLQTHMLVCVSLSRMECIFVTGKPAVYKSWACKEHTGCRALLQSGCFFTVKYAKDGVAWCMPRMRLLGVCQELRKSGQRVCTDGTGDILLRCRRLTGKKNAPQPPVHVRDVNPMYALDLQPVDGLEVAGHFLCLSHASIQKVIE